MFDRALVRPRGQTDHQNQLKHGSSFLWRNRKAGTFGTAVIAGRNRNNSMNSPAVLAAWPHTEFPADQSGQSRRIAANIAATHNELKELQINKSQSRVLKDYSNTTYL